MNNTFTILNRQHWNELFHINPFTRDIDRRYFELVMMQYSDKNIIGIIMNKGRHRPDITKIHNYINKHHHKLPEFIKQEPPPKPFYDGQFKGTRMPFYNY